MCLHPLSPQQNDGRVGTRANYCVLLFIAFQNRTFLNNEDVAEKRNGEINDYEQALIKTSHG